MGLWKLDGKVTSTTGTFDLPYCNHINMIALVDILDPVWRTSRIGSMDSIPVFWVDIIPSRVALMILLHLDLSPFLLWYLVRF